MKNLIRVLPLKIRKSLFTLKLYVKAPKLFFLSKTAFNTTPPPVVLLSFPRSGSSWIGSIMGTGLDVRYLREPATTNYTLTKNKNASKINRISVFDQASCNHWPEYQKYIDDSLSAKPNFTHAVVASPEQWQSPKEQKALLIKEVNPLAINYYLSNTIKLIYLVRHPFSVAKSYQALNWRAKDLFSKKFNNKTMSEITNFMPNIQKENIWLQMGYLQGWIEALAKEHIATSENSFVIIRYEDVCQTPYEQFKALFNFANIHYSENIITKIKNSQSRKDNVAAGDFSLKRNSTKLAQIKIPTEEHDTYFQLMNAYQQAFNDFRKSRKFHLPPSKSVSISYCKDSPFVELY